MADVRARDGPVVVSCVLCAVAAYVYLTKPDALAAVTIWPFWVLLFAFLLPAAVSLRKRNWKPRALLLLASLLVWLATGEEIQSLARSIVPVPSDDLRVVSLNCAGSAEAAIEVVALQPDIVLLQESMGKDALEKVRAALGADWTMFVGVDASILARGTLEPAMPPFDLNYTAAWLGETLIVSLRLQPPVFRLDYWNPACWREYADNKRARRRELAALIEAVEEIANGKPIILGGDFNTPPDETLTEPLTYTGLDDAFAVSGRGWGATAVNDYPMVRIDQIWASFKYIPVNAYSRKTTHSDHQVAVAEFARH